MQSEIHEGNAMRYSDCLLIGSSMCLVSTFFSTTGFAEPADQVQISAKSMKKKTFSKGPEREYAGIWRIETIASKGVIHRSQTNELSLNNKVRMGHGPYL